MKLREETLSLNDRWTELNITGCEGWEHYIQGCRISLTQLSTFTWCCRSWKHIKSALVLKRNQTFLVCRESFPENCSLPDEQLHWLKWCSFSSSQKTVFFSGASVIRVDKKNFGEISTGFQASMLRNTFNYPVIQTELTSRTLTSSCR